MAKMEPPVISPWGRLGTPFQVIASLAGIALLLGIYREAELFLDHLASVLLLFIFASLIAIVLTPLVDFLQKLPPLIKHRTTTVILLYLAFTSLLVGLGFLVIPTFLNQGSAIPEILDRAQAELHQFGLFVDLSPFKNNFIKGGPPLQLGLIGGVIGGIISVVLVLVISIYLLIQGRSVVATFRKLFPSNNRLFDFLVLAVGSTTQDYVRGQILMSLIVGTYTTLAMTLLGVHYALLLGVAAAFLELVPLIGAVVAMILATAIALLQSPSLAIAALVAGLLGHAIDAYLIGPRVTGRVTQLHPLIAMAALLIGAEVGGVLGALFGVPLAAIANIILGAIFRRQQGDAPLSTHPKGKVTEETLPRLGDEIGG